MVATSTLVKISAIGGLVVSATGYFMQTTIIDRARNYDYYRNALVALRKHPGAIELLGEPIKDARFKLTEPEDNFSDGKTAQFKIPVKGPKQKANYYFWAERHNEKWQLTRAELELKNTPDRRLAIIKETNTTVQNNNTK